MERGFGRRSAPRLPLRMPARLIVPDRTCPVVLEDLSARGASVTLPEACEFVVGVLRWMDRHAFAEVAWREGLSLGLQFDRPLTAEVLEATRLYAREHWVLLRQGDPMLRRC